MCPDDNPGELVLALGPATDPDPPPAAMELAIGKPAFVPPFATNPAGNPAVAFPPLPLYLPVAGLALSASPAPAPALLSFRRSGVDCDPLRLWILPRLVVSNIQCVQCRQCAAIAWLGFFLTFCAGSGGSSAWSSASDVVTRCSVEPLDLALRITPSLGGGMGLRVRDVLTERKESLSTGGGGASSPSTPGPTPLCASESCGRSGGTL